MEFNIAQSFKYIFQDKKWLANYFILFGIHITSAIFSLVILLKANDTKIVLIGNIVFYILTCLILGIMSYLNNMRILMPQNNSIRFNFNKIFLNGLRWMGLNMLLGISIAVFVFVLTLIISAGVLIFNASSASVVFGVSLGLLIGFIFLCAYMLYIDLAFLTFSINLKFSSFFEIEKFKIILINNFEDYIIFSLIRLGIGSLFSLVNILTLGITAPLSFFVMADLNGQFIRKILKLETEQKQG